MSITLAPYVGLVRYDMARFSLSAFVFEEILLVYVCLCLH